MKFNQVTVTQLVDNYIEDYAANQSNFDEGIFYKWAADITNKVVGANLEQWVERIVVLQVENYSAQIPADFKKLIQLSYLDQSDVYETRWQVTQAVYDNIVDDCDLEINLKCPDCYKGQKVSTGCGECDYSYVEVDVDTIWRDAHPELIYGHMKHYIGTGSTVADINRSTYHNSFQLMKPTTSPYFNLQYHIPTCRNLNVDVAAEYRFESASKLVVNFEKGMLLFSYFGTPMDSHGDALVPDIPEMYELVSFYIDEKSAWIEYTRTRSPESYKLYQVAQHERMRTMRLTNNQLSKIDIHEFWAKMEKYYRSRLGRKWDRNPLTQYG